MLKNAMEFVANDIPDDLDIDSNNDSSLSLHAPKVHSSVHWHGFFFVNLRNKSSHSSFTYPTALFPKIYPCSAASSP